MPAHRTRPRTAERAHRSTPKTAEHRRLQDARRGAAPWKAWGPYLSERQWGTVREDYSDGGDAWSYFPHEHARSRAYRWGEDGIAGFCDDRQRMCLALALWNGADPILKERMFGLANGEGNHGEDAKEYWFYLDSTPTHSYARCQYKYPQAPFPYEDLVATNARRDKQDMEYELLDTGIFEGGRYFDVIVEYTKAAPDDILMRVTAINRGPDEATLHLLPTLWFRNTWSWGDEMARPELRAAGGAGGARAIAEHPELGEWQLWADDAAPLLFCENETNNQRLFGVPNATAYVKDGINDHLVGGEEGAVNPGQTGTKVAAHHVLDLPAGEAAEIRVRLTGPAAAPAPRARSATRLGAAFDRVVTARQAEADAFYATVIPETLDPDAARVMRQALAGLLWSKQYYEFDVHRWLREHGVDPWDPRAATRGVRNVPWFHMVAGDVISMPDKWEYPWFAAWDLAFHCAPLSLVDVDFAKEQVELLLTTRYLHPNGQIPAYEWNFSDVNPPVTAWAALYVYEREAEIRGQGDREFLARVFERLLTNFTWWVNRKDPDDRNLFQGGFLGLDNIGIFDRSAPLPGGGTLEQADGTAWMALYCQWMLQIALELARHDPAYADMALKFIAHFAWIAVAVNPPGGDSALWDEEDGFYYDVMRMPDGATIPLKVRSLVGLLPICAATVFEPDLVERHPQMFAKVREFAQRFSDSLPQLADLPGPNPEGRRITSLVAEERLRRILTVMLDEHEFLGAHGIRAISRRHLEQPCRFDWGGEEYEVHYLPAESDTGMFGGNSNWRGPVWFPMNIVIIRALLQLHRYYGDRLRIECPTGSGRTLNLQEVAGEIARRLTTTFTRAEDGRRPVFGGIEMFQTDPHWRDLLLFHEYFHGDNGAGIGASHQTGWTGTVALLFVLAQASAPAAPQLTTAGD
ncbi:MAG: MGH1-like glycoside hydrolase domain-containing protein [Solirubrobacteraceae bacterium]